MIDEIIEHILFNLDKPDVDKNGYEGIVSQSVLEAFVDCKERLDKGETLYYYAWW